MKPWKTWLKAWWQACPANLLRFVEVATVLAIVCSMIFAGVLVALWVLYGIGEEKIARLVKVIDSCSRNWHVGLLLMIPLFYVPIREIATRIIELPFGIKAAHPKDQVSAPSVPFEIPNEDRENKL